MFSRGPPVDVGALLVVATVRSPTERRTIAVSPQQSLRLIAEDA